MPPALETSSTWWKSFTQAAISGADIDSLLLFLKSLAAPPKTETVE